MSDRAFTRSKLRAALFATCAACTLWLMVQNTILFTMVPWHRLGSGSLAVDSILRVAFASVAQLALVTLAFFFGWLASRHPARATPIRENAHE